MPRYMSLEAQKGISPLLGASPRHPQIAPLCHDLPPGRLITLLQGTAAFLSGDIRASLLHIASLQTGLSFSLVHPPH